MLISLFDPNDLIGFGGNINQSDFVGLCGSTQGSMWVYVGLCEGLFLRGGGEKSRILC